MKKLIVFVCNGNIHRSVVAEKALAKILLQQDLAHEYSVASYGLQGTQSTPKPLHKKLSEYPKEYQAAKPTLNVLGLHIQDHAYQKLTPAVMKRAATVIAMDSRVYSRGKNSLLKQFPKLKYKIHIFSHLVRNHKDIQDPSGSGSQKLHESIIMTIFSTLQVKFPEIIKWTKE